MNRKTKVGFILLSVALVAVVALTGITALLAGGSTGPSSVSDSAGIRGQIEYTVRDSAGNIKYTRSIHNDDVAALWNAGRGRLGADYTAATIATQAGYASATAMNTAVADWNTAATLATTLNKSLFVSVRLCTSVATSTLCTGADLPTTYTTNPIDTGTQTQASDGVYKVVAGFTASGVPAAIRTLQLTDRNATDASRLVGAYHGVNITLAASDTLDVSWTITIS